MASAPHPGKAPAGLNPSTLGSMFSPNKAVGSGVTSCPAKALKPCDAQKLIVKDAVTGRKVLTTKKRVLEKVPPTTPGWLKEPLGRHDLVLELLADYVTSSGDPPKKKVNLSITSYYTGRCEQALHPKITMEAIRGASAAETKSWNATSSPALELLARSYFLDSHFEGFFLAPFWSFDAVKELLVTARSCGIRRGGDGTPNADLSCLVRIYRNDLYTLTVKIPSFSTLTTSKSSTLNLRGETTHKREDALTVGGFKASEYSHTHVQNAGAGTNFTETKVGGSQGAGQYTLLTEKVGTKQGTTIIEEKEQVTKRQGLIHGSTTESDSTEKGKKTILGTELASCTPVISLKRNGQELDFTGFIANLIDVWARIKKAWDELMAWVPEVGWSVKFTLSLFEGSIIGKWGNTYDKAPPETDRYLAIRTFYEISLALDVFNVKLEGSFGVNITSPGVLDKLLTVKTWELIIQVKGTISSKASISKTLKSSEGPVNAKITSDGTVDLIAQARATLVGVTADARAGATGGLTFEGELKCSFTTSMHVAGEFKRKKITIYAQYTSPITGRTKKVFKDIFDEKTVWKGTLPGTAKPKKVAPAQTPKKAKP